MPALTERTIRILIAEDHDLVRLGLSTLFEQDRELELVGESAHFSETLTLVETLAPDVLLLDLALEDGSIVDRIPELLRRAVKLKILVFTASLDRETHRLALQMGAMGIFTKNTPNSLLLKAIRRVHTGEIWADRHTTAAFFNHFQSAAQSPPATSKRNALTARECQIAQLAAQGVPAKKIAARIGISDKTVRNQLVNVYSKLGVSGLVELALKAPQLGLAPTDSPT